MKSLLSVVFLVGLVLSGSFARAQQPQLRLTIQLDKSQYRVGEPTVVHISLENPSQSDVVVNSRLLVNRPIGPHELFFHLIGPDRKVVSFDARIRASFESREFIELSGKQVLSKNFDLNRVYTLETAGEYTMTLIYENKQDAPPYLKLPPAWKGRLKSNTLKFSIE
ncbi:MAG: hypothetical protein ACT4OT_06410 [Acidobacteriota bacterium]